MGKQTSLHEYRVNSFPVLKNTKTDSGKKISKRKSSFRKSGQGKKKLIENFKKDKVNHSRAPTLPRIGEGALSIFQPPFLITAAAQKGSMPPVANRECFSTILASLPNPRSPPSLPA